MELAILDQDRFYIALYLLKRVLYEFGDYFVEYRTSCLQTGVGVHFDQPYIVVRVDHEIQSKYLKIVDPTLRVNVECRSMYNIRGNPLHFRVNHFEKVKLRILLFNKLVKFFVIYLISLLELAVVR